MSSAVAQSGLFLAKTLQRPAQSFARCSRQQYLRFRAQQVQSKRAFGVSASGWQKKYTEDHEWIDTSSPESASIGISTYAAKALGDVVYVELPTVGLEVSKGDAIGAVESVKSASDIMTPVSGVVTEVNSLLEDKPGTINSSPEADGWIAKVKVTDKGEWEGLMDGQAYKAFTEEVENK
ncbi:hypothetical protein Tdes44962_MAKER08000 [Teratosphaeria destructans]|uniref:Glycine cleavage system H protein n=1 Tax=Teratosphaeria destructans TaxID=418781 RepID=A0A9W7SXM7_9PEZI|nr:hypothetical protein Tdes44962_MAKER08000 [Teratosphaeria destructans]